MNIQLPVLNPISLNVRNVSISSLMVRDNSQYLVEARIQARLNMQQAKNAANVAATRVPGK